MMERLQQLLGVEKEEGHSFMANIEIAIRAAANHGPHRCVVTMCVHCDKLLLNPASDVVIQVATTVQLEFEGC